MATASDANAIGSSGVTFDPAAQPLPSLATTRPPSSPSIHDDGQSQMAVGKVLAPPPPQQKASGSWWNRYVRGRPRPFGRKAHLTCLSRPDVPMPWPDIHHGHSPDSPLFWIFEAGFSPLGSFPDLARGDYNVNRPPFLLRHVPKPIYKHQRRSGMEVKVDVTRVINGTFGGRPAVFVGLSVEHHVRKAKATRVTVKLATGGLDANTTMEYYRTWRGGMDPYIRLFAPKKLYGKPYAVDQSNGYGFEGGLSPAVPTFGGANMTASRTRSTTTSLERRHVIKGWTTGGQASSAPVTFTLMAIENPVTQDGIYDRLPIGLVVETAGRPLLLSVSVEPDEGALSNVASGKPWSTPIYIDQTDWPGIGLPRNLSRRLETWTQDNWAMLVPYPEEHASVLVSDFWDAVA